ncbi:hypothetical protein SRHO_G00205860 [Serrasalmus rhombeus]
MHFETVHRHSLTQARRASRKNKQAIAFAAYPGICSSLTEPEITLSPGEEEGSTYYPLSSSHAAPGAALLAQTRQGPAAPGSSCTERAREKKQGRRALHSLHLCRGLHMSRRAKPCLYQSAAATAETH